MRLARELRAEVVLMDLLMPGIDGATTIGHLRRELPDTALIGLIPPAALDKQS